MFSIRDIRSKARQTVNTTQGIFLLPIIPMVIIFIRLLMELLSPSGSTQLSSISSQGANVVQLASAYIIFPTLYQLLLGLVFLSVTYTLFQMIRKTKEQTSISDALAIFNSPQFGKIFRTFFVKQILLFLWNLIASVGIILLSLSMTLSFVYIITTGSVDTIPENILALIGIFFLLGLLLIIVGISISVPQYYAYSQVEFILFEQLEKGEYAGATAIIKESRQVMKGFKWKRFVLDLSFIGWFILCVITFSLAGVYVLPYYYAAQIHFSQAVKDAVQMRQIAYFNQFNQPTHSNP